MKAYYQARAPEYDRIYSKPERQADLRKLETWVIETLAGRDVLEISAGTGYRTQFYAPKAKHVVATDASQETLSIAKTRKGTENVSFRIADAYDLQENLGIFDAAFAGFWFSHIPKSQIDSFLANLHARLRPKSIILFIDNLYIKHSSTKISAHDIEGNTYQDRPLDDGTIHRILKNFPSENELRDVMQKHGTEVTYLKLDYYWALEYERTS